MANDDLIARLEAAEGPQFVLDVEIWKTCHPADWKWQHGRFNPPAYTASIDAALTLADAETDPLDILEAALASCREERDGVFYLPLHICIAALRACND